MEIEIKGKKFEVKELPYINAVALNPEDKAGSMRILFKKCLDMTDEEINSLNIAEGKIIEKAILKVNNLEDFQIPTEKKE